MADEQQPNATLLQTPFGSERVPVLTLPGAGEQVHPVVKPDGPAVAVTDATFKGDRGFRDAQAARAAREAQPDSNPLEALGATIESWDTTRAIKRLMRPGFDNDVQVNAHEFMNGLDFAPDEAEHEYVFDMASKGAEAGKYAVGVVQEQRAARKVMGEHELVATAGAFLDPVWLAATPVVGVGRLGAVAGRVASAAVGGLGAAIITEAGEGARDDTELALNILMNASAGALLFRGGKHVQMDSQFPAAALKDALDGAQAGAEAAVKPRYKMTKPAEWEEPTAPGGERRKVAEPVFERLPDSLQPGAINVDPARIVADVDEALAQNSRARGLGEKLMWNMHKTMGSFGETGKKIADLLYDNNSNLSLTSLESHREAILNGLRQKQFVYEDLMREATAADGFGTLQFINPMRSRQAYAAQNAIERKVQRELFRREQYANRGEIAPEEGVHPRIAKMADALDDMHKAALGEMKAAGVFGAENILERPGYLNRRWSSQAIDTVMDKLEAMGLDRKAARAKVNDLVALSLRRGNPKFDVPLAKSIGTAIVDRALNKGMFEDGMFNGAQDAYSLGQMRNFLNKSGLSPEDVERGMDILRVQSDEAGKAAYTKHRMDLDYRAQIRVGDEWVSIMDLIDNRVTSIVDQYNQKVATNAAMARKGFAKSSDVANLRRELLASVHEAERPRAAELFDNTMAHFRGDPAGAKVNENFRLMQAYGRTISLAWSGLWQLTEHSNIMGEFGLRKALQYTMKEIPGFKQIMGDAGSARSLNNVLAEHSSQSMRLRPYLAKFEDGYEMDTASAAQLSAQTLGQMVPMANAMKYVHHAQAKIVGNLILDRLDMAAKGNEKAREALAKYGIDSPVMDRIALEMQKHGFDVDKWTNSVWAEARPAFAKMMDASVLKSRLGDTPAFAQFDQLGKFIFTYRTFVLTAHNKVLAGGLERNGAGAVGLVMLYQFPLALAAVQAQSYIRGQGTLTEDKLVAGALGQMGGLGLFSEPLKWASGQSNSVGSPAMIPIDRGVKLFQSGVQGDGQKFSSTLATMIPTLSAVPFVNGLSHRLKE